MKKAVRILLITKLYFWFIILICILACILVFVEFFNERYNAGYLDACKDFKKGNLKYTLVDNSDGTSVWKKISKVNEK